MNKNKKIIICRVVGGLGNQLFCFAAAYALSRKLNRELILDQSFYINDIKYHRVFVLNQLVGEYKIVKTFLLYGFFKRVLIRFLSLIGVMEYRTECKYNSFENEYFNFSEKKIIYSDGYRQHFSYSSGVAEEMIDHINGNLDLLFMDKLNDKYPQLISAKDNICVHYRSYKEVKCLNNNGPSVDFYNKAIASLLKLKPHASVYIFSDDLDAAKKLFHNLQNVTYVDENDDLFEFYMMSKCNNFVISNSSFSWWSATLSKSNSIFYPSDSQYKNYPSPHPNWTVM